MAERLGERKSRNGPPTTGADAVFSGNVRLPDPARAATLRSKKKPG